MTNIEHELADEVDKKRGGALNGAVLALIESPWQAPPLGVVHIAKGGIPWLRLYVVSVPLVGSSATSCVVVTRPDRETITCAVAPAERWCTSATFLFRNVVTGSGLSFPRGWESGKLSHPRHQVYTHYYRIRVSSTGS